MNARERLSRLARSQGVETSYVDLSGRRRVASPKAIRAVLRALGSRPTRRPEPVRVAWDGILPGSRRRRSHGLEKIRPLGRPARRRQPFVLSLSMEKLAVLPARLVYHS